MTCAADRRPPSSEYLLKLDQPAISRPTTDRPPTAKKYSRPMLRSWPNRPGRERDDQQASSRWPGSTTTGAQVKTSASAPVGVKSSFMRTLSPWTTDSSDPNGPTRSGPIRRFISAMIFISM